MLPLEVFNFIVDKGYVQLIVFTCYFFIGILMLYFGAEYLIKSGKK